MGAEDWHFSRESQLEVAQHAYFQEMLGTVVSEVGEVITHRLWTSHLKAKAKQREIIWPYSAQDLRWFNPARGWVEGETGMLLEVVLEGWKNFFQEA